MTNRLTNNKPHLTKGNPIKFGLFPIFCFMIVVFGLGFTIGDLQDHKSDLQYNYNQDDVVGAPVISAYYLGGKAAIYKLGVAGNPYDSEEDKIGYIRGYISELDKEKLVPND